MTQIISQWNGNVVNSYKSRGAINTNFGINKLKWAVCCEVVSGLMTSPARFLSGAGGGSGGAPAAPPPDLAVDSDVVVILAALLCALICVVGLALVARCAWLRRSLSAAAAAAAHPADKGLKKKALRALPRTTFDGAAAGVDGGECAICLAEFAQGDEIRVLPQCGHGFHVGCVDTWLSSHSSCPSCRRVLVVARCRPPAPESEGDVKAREDRRNRFLP